MRAAMFYEPGDVRMEAVPAPEQSLQMVRKGGDVTLFGRAPSGTSFEVGTALLHYSQLMD